MDEGGGGAAEGFEFAGADGGGDGMRGGGERACIRLGKNGHTLSAFAALGTSPAKAGEGGGVVAVDGGNDGVERVDGSGEVGEGEEAGSLGGEGVEDGEVVGDVGGGDEEGEIGESEGVAGGDFDEGELRTREVGDEGFGVDVRRREIAVGGVRG